MVLFYHCTFTPLCLCAIRPLSRFIMITKLLSNSTSVSKKTFGSNVSTVIVMLIFLTLSSAPQALCQIPQGFNYQALVRDGTGEIMAEATIDVKIDIETAGSTLIWSESHTTVQTTQYGLMSIVVGQGTRIGGSATNFYDIDWNAEPLYLRTTIDLGEGPLDMGTTQIWAVPYSLMAKDVEGPIEKLGVEATTTDLEEALFEVKNHTGQTVFAVYNEGVRIYVDDGAKGPKGGFAIGGFGTEKAPSMPLLVVDPDSIRMYIDKSGKTTKGGFAIGGYGTDKADIQDFLFISDDSVRVYIDNEDDDYPPKGVKGGFAIGGYGTAKGPIQNLLTVSNDSIRIYLDKDGPDKGPKGGFAIGGYGALKGEDEEYLRVTRDSTRVYVKEDLKTQSGGFAIGGIGTVPGTITKFTSFTPDNYFIGHNSGENTDIISGGTYNTFFGFQSGMNNNTGSKNSFMGYKSGYHNTTGDYNVYIGNTSGYRRDESFSNVIIGTYSYPEGDILDGNKNVFIGNEAGKLNIGDGSVIIGDNAGRESEGGGNIYVGFQSGINSIGTTNVVVGYLAGSYGYLGNDNVIMGTASGLNVTGDGNVFIGNEAGRQSEVTSVNNKLYIDNSDTSTPLIYGDFSTDELTFNADIIVNGSISGNEYYPGFHLALIENSSTETNADVLALKVNNTDDPGASQNFITFFKGGTGDTRIGRIEGNGSGGINFVSGAGDYAEYLPVMVSDDAFQKGEIVGIREGKITRNTDGAEFVMGISSTPIVTGNDPGEDNHEGYDKVAFIGIVPVMVKGMVKGGQYIVASGNNDGTGIALSLEEISAEQYDQIVGVAWESSDIKKNKLIKTAVGLSSWIAPVKQQQQKIEELEQKLERMNELEKEIDELKNLISEKY
jgi:hypothetical protein